MLTTTIHSKTVMGMIQKITGADYTKVGGQPIG
jgi:hypothetical protein